MRQVLAQNVSALMEIHYRGSSNKPKALAADAGVSLSTIQRMLDLEAGASMDTIEAVAGAFQLSSYQLLVPGLNAGNPQVVKGATKEEERLYRMWQLRRSQPIKIIS
jgi:hypothetical protein